MSAFYYLYYKFNHLLYYQDFFIIYFLFQSRPYSYNFGVSDSYSGVDYNRAESRSDRGVTKGSYTVALPDGRIQTVSYTGKEALKSDLLRIVYGSQMGPKKMLIT